MIINDKCNTKRKLSSIFSLIVIKNENINKLIEMKNKGFIPLISP